MSYRIYMHPANLKAWREAFEKMGMSSKLLDFIEPLLDPVPDPAGAAANEVELGGIYATDYRWKSPGRPDDR